jgi:glutathione synthase/RimK-type ligase-like ATP-grasp enzyme
VSKVLIVSHGRDTHAGAVRAELSELGADHFVFDLGTLPQQAMLTLDYEPVEPVATYRHEAAGSIDVSAFGAVWWRRPQYVDLSHVEDDAARIFSEGEWDEALAGLWPMLDAFWINEPHTDRRASRKAWQLKEAKRMGLPIPRTAITSDPDVARAFVESCGGPEKTVYKSFSATYAAWRETRRMRPEELDVIDMVRVAPVIFQEYVPAGVDLRITVIGDEVFPAAIQTEETDYQADFRMSLGRGVRIVPDTIPDDLHRGLLALMRRLGLVYGAIDVRRTPSGDHFFLEINTAGQWLFVEQETHQPITRTLAESLAKEAATRGSV